MKVLFVAAGKKGGFSPFIMEQRDALVQAGHTVTEYAHGAHGIVRYMREVSHLRKAIRQEKPDVVHAHFGLTGLMAGLAAVGTGVPVVVTYHGCDINDTKLRPFSRIAMRLATWNIFVSKRQMINGYGSESKAAKAKKGCVLPCGINTQLFDEKYVDDAWYEAKFGEGDKVLFGGDFGRDVKNAPLAFAAMEVLNENYKENTSGNYNNYINQKNIKKIEESSDTCSINNNLDHMSAQERVLGQSSAQSCSIDSVAQTLSNDSSTKKPKNISSESVQAQNAENGGVELIEMKGFTREQVVTLMHRSKALLLTSIREGSPQVVKEAMACGCPIVSVDVGDVSERLDGLEGCYVVSSREPKDIADALKKAIAFGRTKGRERLLADGLDNAQIAERLISIYKKVIKKG